MGAARRPCRLNNKPRLRQIDAAVALLPPVNAEFSRADVGGGLFLIANLICRVLKGVSRVLGALSDCTGRVLSFVAIHAWVAIFDGVSLFFSRIAHRVCAILEVVGFVFERRFLFVFLTRIARAHRDQHGGEKYRSDK